MYTVDYFIKKFKNIPSENWTVGKVMDEVGRCCALGHCGVRDVNSKWVMTPEAKALIILFGGSEEEGEEDFSAVYTINDLDSGVINTGLMAKKNILEKLESLK